MLGMTIRQELVCELIASIIRKAVIDGQMTNKEISEYKDKRTRTELIELRNEARDFFKSKQFDFYCTIAGIDKDAILRLISFNAKNKIKLHASIKNK